MGIQIRNKDIINQSLLNAITKTPGYIFLKDRHLRLIGCNANFAKIAGETTTSIINKTDYDLPWKKKESDTFREDDSEVIESGINKLNIVEPMRQANGATRLLLTSKIPLLNLESRITGLLGIFVDVTLVNDGSDDLSKNKFKETIREKLEFIKILKLQLLNSINSLVNLIEIDIKKSASQQQLCANKILEHSNNIFSYINAALKINKLKTSYLKEISSHFNINFNGETACFTRREIQCLAHVFFGRTAKETAKILKISPKTIESYISLIKQKIGCHTRSELVQLIIKNELIDIMKYYGES